MEGALKQGEMFLMELAIKSEKAARKEEENKQFQSCATPFLL